MGELKPSKSLFKKKNHHTPFLFNHNLRWCSWILEILPVILKDMSAKTETWKGCDNLEAETADIYY